MDDLSITKKGNPLDESLYIIDLDKKLFATKQAYVSIDCNLNGWTFKTGGGCIFHTKSNCTFDTGGHCTFKTDANCRFNTGESCTFKTNNYCTFRAGYNCNFDTGVHCKFKTSYQCIFKTSVNGIFDTGSHCTFYTDWNCTFKTGSGCTFSIWGIDTQTFKSYDGYSIILDRKATKRYILNKSLIDMLKVANG